MHRANLDSHPQTANIAEEIIKQDMIEFMQNERMLDELLRVAYLGLGVQDRVPEQIKKKYMKNEGTDFKLKSSCVRYNSSCG